MLFMQRSLLKLALRISSEMAFFSHLRLDIFERKLRVYPESVLRHLTFCLKISHYILRKLVNQSHQQ